MGASTPEGRVKQQIKARLRTVPGLWFYMPVQNGMGVVGIPDFIVCYRGRLLAIETKAPGKTAATTPHQKAQLAAIQDAGGTTMVVDSVEPVEAWIGVMQKLGLM